MNFVVTESRMQKELDRPRFTQIDSVSLRNSIGLTSTSPRYRAKSKQARKNGSSRCESEESRCGFVETTADGAFRRLRSCIVVSRRQE